MYCSQCGSQLPDDANFCPKCGSSQGSHQTTAAAPSKVDEVEIEVCRLPTKRGTYVITNRTITGGSLGNTVVPIQAIVRAVISRSMGFRHSVVLYTPQLMITYELMCEKHQKEELLDAVRRAIALR